MGIFEYATMNKVRFTTPMKGGTMTAEDLGDLSLEGLNEVAKSLSKEIKAGAEESFIGAKTSVTKELEVKFAIVKRVIEIRLAARDAQRTAKAKKARNEQIMSLIADKENDALAGKSIEELRALMD